ncbi:MAG: VanZ family protein [Clostridia bacterium]|nr:VanZ family protein [Clostridia bacterium]
MNKKLKVAVRYIFWFISFDIMTVIFLLSSQDSTTSANLSSGFISRLLETFSDEFLFLSESEKQVLIEALQHVVRKLAHFSIYASLGASLFSAAYTYEIKLVGKFLIALPISLIYAVSDEIHQNFIPGRGAMLTDVLIDFSGAVFGSVVILIIISIYKSILNRRKTMRKKQLMQRLSEAVMTIESLHAKIKDLTAENTELSNKLEALAAQIKTCDQKAEQNSNPIKEVAPKIETKEPVKSEEPADGFTVKVLEDIDFDNVKEIPVTEVIDKPEPILSDDALEYGANVIGKITVESAKFCDKITSKGGNNTRELLGLIMGKSEVCKNDILSIAMSDAENENKLQLIDAQYNEALDYFKSVVEQNN